ncbi:HNH endonuclease [Geobacillus subterraneus]|uniref:HNH nuclease domain-containing protein n=1 Tax=Geobacillus subterraneus TaxID=129338 RepID=A0A679FY85_9BACL|nr:HNH endonuclease signature motif containing protein [Geobacillus subterraneus]BBW99037.1 hypothetical protein GsuE55_38700 [Geobacillus subterraneus]
MQEGKVCSKCKVWKPFSEFGRGKDTKLGYRSACKECERKRKKPYVNVKCERCGIEFKRRKDNVKEINYCVPCAKKIAGEKARGKIIPKARKGEYIKCDNCGKLHYKKRSQLKKDYKHRFCSHKCQAEWAAKHKVPGNLIKSVDNRGEKNGRYKNGKRIGEHERHKELKQQIKQRDGEGCLFCKTNEFIHVHRIIPGAFGGKYTLENCVLLCREHHQMVHDNYDYWKNELLKMIGVGVRGA